MHCYRTTQQHSNLLKLVLPWQGILYVDRLGTIIYKYNILYIIMQNWKWVLLLLSKSFYSKLWHVSSVNVNLPPSGLGWYNKYFAVRGFTWQQTEGFGLICHWLFCCCLFVFFISLMSPVCVPVSVHDAAAQNVCLCLFCSIFFVPLDFFFLLIA